MSKLIFVLLTLVLLLPNVQADSQTVKAAIKPSIIKLLQLVPSSIKEEYLSPKIESAVDNLKRDVQDLGDPTLADFLADTKIVKKAVTDDAIAEYVYSNLESKVNILSQLFTNPVRVKNSLKNVQKQESKPSLSGSIEKHPTPNKNDAAPSSHYGGLKTCKLDSECQDGFYCQFVDFEGKGADQKVCAELAFSESKCSGTLITLPQGTEYCVQKADAVGSAATGLQKITFSIPKVYPNAASGEQCINDGSCQEGLKCKPWPGGKLAGNFCQGEKISTTPVVCSGDHSSTAYNQCVADSYIPKNEYTTGKDRLPSVQSIDALQCNQDSDCTATLGPAHFCGAIVSGTPRVCLTGLRPKAGFVECDSGSGCTVPQDVCVLIAAGGKHPDPVHARGAVCVPS